ncbi:MAG TPA: hypothetical protein PLK90_07970 [Clostridiales bacterium]|nr:hypothetical protein [Clostridiales bacterium]HQP70320.1 hypothetical protein [Clostridiales bacterium]
MTSKVTDRVKYKGKNYELIGSSRGELLFNIFKYGLNPAMMHTGCYRGFYCGYELHHAGFTAIKKEMPTLNITTYAGMSRIIEYFTHLEGMGVYAPLEERRKDNALNNDRDYTALFDKKLMKEYETQYFAIYSKFINSPDKELAADDWNFLSEMSDGKRLWYTVGAMMAEKIDRTSGREHLVSLIAQPSENFIKEYRRE